VKTEAVGLERLDAEESRIDQDAVKIPGTCLLELCFPAPPLRKTNFSFESVVEAGSSPGSSVHPQRPGGFSQERLRLCLQEKPGVSSGGAWWELFCWEGKGKAECGDLGPP